MIVTAPLNDSEPVVTSLPINARDGQVVILQSAAMAAVGVGWRMRYNANAYGTLYNWDFLGGPPWQTSNAASAATSSTTYTNLTGVMSLNPPAPGDYFVEIGCYAATSANIAQWLSFDAGTTAAVDATAFVSQQPALATIVFSGSNKSRVNGVDNTVREKARVSSAVSGTFYNRFLNITPIRLVGQ